MSQCEHEKRRKLMRIVMGNENNDLTHIKLYFHLTLLLTTNLTQNAPFP